MTIIFPLASSIPENFYGECVGEYKYDRASTKAWKKYGVNNKLSVFDHLENIFKQFSIFSYFLSLKP